MKILRKLAALFAADRSVIVALILATAAARAARGQLPAALLAGLLLGALAAVFSVATLRAGAATSRER